VTVTGEGMTPREPVDVVVVGGGVAGLACADRLRMRRVKVVLLEASAERPGGRMHTDLRPGGFLVERGPQTVFGEPVLLDLARRLGLTIVERPKSERARFLVREGRLRSPLRAISLGGILRLLWGVLVAGAPPGEDETVQDYARRRFGEEAARRLFDALVGGTFAGDASRLAYASALARFGRRKGRLVTFEGGLGALPRALATSLGDAVRLGAKVVRVEALREASGAGSGTAEGAGTSGGGGAGTAGARYAVHLEGGERVPARAVVLALPAQEAGEAVRDLDAPLASLLRAIPSGQVTTVALGFDARAFPKGAPRGFGFLVPSCEGLPILGCLYCPAPEGKVLLRVMLRGIHADGAAIATARTEIARLLGSAGDPTLVDVIRHERAIPQYEAGHAARLRAIEERRKSFPGLGLIGWSYRGIAVPDVVADARRAADELADELGAPSGALPEPERLAR